VTIRTQSCYGAPMKTVLSLFDHTGTWSAPWRDAGHDVIEVDIQNWVPIDIMDADTADYCLDVYGSPDVILAAPPCTDFASSGAQYWGAKDADGRTAKSLDLVMQVLRMVDLYRPTDEDYLREHGDLVWCIENPVGRLSKLIPCLGDPWYFHPHEFAGWCDLPPADLMRLDELRSRGGSGVTSSDADFVMRSNAYTKKTGLWGNFARPERRVLDPVKVCAQGSPLMRQGGSGSGTKNYRSATPDGFARAFYAANC
jgi:hypothetical protein